MTDVDNTAYDSDTPVVPDAFANANLSESDKSFLQREIEKARADSEAVKSEFLKASEEDPINGVIDAAKKRVQEALPEALDNIIQTAKLGGTESIRFQASKYIADLALGTKKSGGSDPKDDKFKNFIEGILSGETEVPTSTEIKKGSDG